MQFTSAAAATALLLIPSFLAPAALAAPAAAPCPPSASRNLLASNDAVSLGNHFRQPTVLIEFLTGVQASYIRVPLNSFVSPSSMPELPRRPSSVRIMAVHDPEGGVWFGEERVHCSVLGGVRNMEGEVVAVTENVVKRDAAGEGEAEQQDGVVVLRRRDRAVSLERLILGEGVVRFGCRAV